MSQPSNKLTNLWQELKRRNVVRVVSVYAAAAFVIIELVNNVTEPLKLPEWTPTLVIIILLVGFPLAIIFSWIFDVTPDGIERTKPSNELPKGDKPLVPNSWKIATYISGAIIIGLLILNIFDGKKRVSIDESLEKSIAVLPFHNFSGDSDQDFICYGLTDEIIGHLYKIKSFDWIQSLTSVLNYRDSDRITSEIANDLGVNYILDGSYKRIGDELRITAQLLDKSGNHIWLNDYDLPYHEVMGIPAEIALQIANHLKAFIADDEQHSIKRLPTENTEAYKLLQQSIYINVVKGALGVSESLTLAKKAIELDPNYASAFAWAGIWTLYNGAFSGTKEMSFVVWEALPYFEKALDMDEDNFRAHFGMGHISEWIRWDYVKAENVYTKGINLEPKNYPNYSLYVEFFMKMDRLDDALKYAKLQSVSEQNMNWRETIKLNVLTGDRTEASSILNEYIKMFGESSYPWAGEHFIWLQEYDSAKQYLEAAVISEDPHLLYPRFLSCLALAYHGTKDYYKAQTTISQLINKSDTTSAGDPEYFTGWYYSWIGEVDSAFHWLEKAYNNRSPELPWLKVDPAFNNLKDDDRYWDLYERTGHKAYDDYMASKNK